jgi:hypothetical protein
MGVPGADVGLELFRDGVDSNPAKALGRRLGETALEAPCAEVSAWNSYHQPLIGYVLTYILRILSLRVLFLDNIDALQLPVIQGS